MHEEDLLELFQMFESLPGYKSIDRTGVVYWFGTEEDDVFVCATFGPKGLHFESELEDDDWFIWMAIFLKKASATLGYEVKIV